MKVSGAKIREYREAFGLTRDALASKIDPPTTRQCVEHWERDGVGTFRLLAKVAAALGVRPEALIVKS
jgi:DNA-binding XRE family transcriptional regulator